MSLLSLSQRRMPAFIAVLAILMLFIAPEVSKTLAQWHAENAVAAHSQHAGLSHHTVPDRAMPAHNMAGMSASGMAHHAMPAMSAGSSAQKADHDASQPAMGGMATMDDLACGYCDLLVHFPFMIWVLIPLIWLLCTSTRAPPVRLIVSFFAAFLPGTCLPRAPPAR